MRITAPLLAVALLAPGEPAMAADAGIVTGLGLGGSPGDAAYDLVVIDRDRLTLSASGRMEDVLRDVAGFQQYRRSDARSAHPSSQGATLRGLGGNAATRALILLDGVPMLDPFGGWVSWAALDPARIGHVRVTRGGGGVLGPGALAGTIELSSPTPAEAPALAAGLAYGSRGSLDGDASLNQRLGGGFATVSAGYARGAGFVPIVAGDRGPIDRRARHEQSRLSARAVFPIGDSTELQANGGFLLDRRDRGVPFTGNAGLALDTSLRLVGKGAWGWEATGWLQARQFSSGFASIGVGRASVSESLDQYKVPATGEGGRFEIRPALGSALTLRFGGDLRHVDGRSQDHVPSTVIHRKTGGTQSVAGGFADVTIEAGRLTATASGRIDRWSLDRGFRSEVDRVTGASIAANNLFYPDRSGTEATSRGGIAWRPVGAISVRASAYTGWRLPTLNELYRPFCAGDDSINPNPLLDPERLKGVEGGAVFEPFPGWRLGITAFWNRLDDAIADVADAGSTTVRIRSNLDAIRSRGLEADALATIGRWRLSASFSHVDARVRGSGAAIGLDGLRPAQTPNDQASASVEWSRPGAVRLGATLRYVGRQYEDDRNSRSLDAALTVDAVAAVPIGHGWSVDLRGENIADARVEAAVGADGVVERATPRTLWIGLRYATR